MKPICQLALASLLLWSPAVLGLQHSSHRPVGDRSAIDPAWSELNSSMGKMHSAIAAINSSGNTDFDFVRLMIPHHQAAIDMAKTQLLFGKDRQMRRLAEEIVADQQSEIALMQLWLKQHEPQK